MKMKGLLKYLLYIIRDNHGQIILPGAAGVVGAAGEAGAAMGVLATATTGVTGATKGLIAQMNLSKGAIGGLVASIDQLLGKYTDIFFNYRSSLKLADQYSHSLHNTAVMTGEAAGKITVLRDTFEALSKSSIFILKTFLPIAR